MGSLKNLVYLTDEQYRELKANGTITVDDKTIEYSENDLYITPAVGNHPVGDVYISVNDVDPAALFGGTWEQITDCFLLASGSKYPLKDESGNNATGGSADAVLIEHTHDIPAKYSVSTGSYSAKLPWTSEGGTEGNTETLPAGQGEDGIGKNMPPYFTVNVWYRLA